ncbi:MAG TPA: hypothetical protein VF993_10890 [Myxococcales bacterium]
MRTGMLIAALLCATPALAQETQEPPPPPGDTQLSKEDEELVKELALLERLELVKNLELFEPEKDDEEPKPPPQGQP